MVDGLAFGRFAVVGALVGLVVASCSSDDDGGSPSPDADAGDGDGAAGSDAGADARSDVVTSPDARPDSTAGESICGNGLDDDGNGLVDEGCPCSPTPPAATQPCYGGPKAEAGKGRCTLGTQYCSPTSATTATWGDCVGSGAPEAETCNDLDDDCDGQKDEELTQFCRNGGSARCAAGQWSACEECNGADDDGDLATDEDLLRPCTDSCSEWGFQTCVSASWTTCTPERAFDGSIDRAGVRVDAASFTRDDDVTGVAWTHTTSGTLQSRLLLVGVAIDRPGATIQVTHGGVPLTSLAAWTADSTFVEMHVQVHYLLDPAPGPVDVAVTVSESRSVSAGSYTFGNVAAVPLVLGSAKERSTMPTLDVTVPEPSLVVEFLGKEANHGISPSPQSELGWDVCGPGYARFASSIRAVPTGSSTLSWEYDCCSDEWILGAVALRAGTR